MLGPSSWLDRAARTWPDHEAIFDETRSLTFRKLHEAALQAATWLARQGPPGERVAIALPFGVESTVLYFGTLLAGMVAVPLDPVLTPGQCQAMIREIDPVALIESPDLNLPASSRIHRIEDDVGLQRLMGQSPSDRTLPALPEDPSRLLNIVYTSGSTGRPKGVMLTEGNLEAVIRGIQKALSLHERNRIFTALSFAHTYGLSQLWLMATVGASLGVIPDVTRMANIKKMILERGIDVIAGVPYHFALFTRRSDPGVFQGIRHVTVAGDGASKRLVERIKATFPAARIHVMYGLTEASTRLTMLPPEDLETRSGSMGRPIEGVALKVVDEEGRETGLHEEGELIARGPSISPGYWKDESLTRKTFVDGWLRTGDIVKRDPEGYYYHVGRKDSVFKSGGEKIVPAAIERVLAEIGGVENVLVVGIEDPFRGKKACALIVKEKGSRLSTREIQALCRSKLHPLWVPSEIVFVDALPRTPDGKTVRRISREQLQRLKKRLLLQTERGKAEGCLKS